MSVLVPPLPSTTNNHHHYFPNTTTTRRLNGTYPISTGTIPSKSMSTMNRSKKSVDNSESDGDHVPFGVVNVMKQRLLDKVNESLLLSSNSPINRQTLSKQLSRLSSHENLLLTKPSLSTTVPSIHQIPISPLKRTTRLSRSQDSLCNNNNNSKEIGTTYLGGHAVTAEQLTSFLQPKQDVIIVDTSTDNVNDNMFRTTQKTSAHRHSYTELHIDEAPKPGTVNTVKNMFERQIRLSRYDADKLFNSSTPGSSSRMGSQHREISSPPRSRSMSPNDMALRQRRMTIPPIIPSTSTALSLPAPASYPDLVTSHTPPTSSHIETNKTNSEQSSIHNNPSTPLAFAEVTLSSTSNNQGKLFGGYRATAPVLLEHIPPVPTEDASSIVGLHHHRPAHHLLTSSSLPSSPPINTLPSISSDTADPKPLDFKSRLALFSRPSSISSANIPRSNDIPQVVPTATIPTTPSNPVVKKPTTNHHPVPSPPNFLTKPVVHHHSRLLNDEKKETNIDAVNHHPFPAAISRSVVNTAKAVTFFGGTKINGNIKSTSSLPASVTPPPAIKTEQISMPMANESVRAPDIIGGNIKLNKSSMASGAKKDVRVQFMDDVDTFEYPSFELAMAELKDTGSDNEDDRSSTSSNDSNGMTKESINEENTKNEKKNSSNQIEDVDDDELDQLARINAEFNSNNLGEKPLKPKGTLHTFRPTHLDQYELGTQHGPNSIPSDISSSYSLLTRQKLLPSSDRKQQSAVGAAGAFDTGNTVQWSSMSTTTDLLF